MTRSKAKDEEKAEEKEGKREVNAAEAVATSDDDKVSIAFANLECTALIKYGTGATVQSFWTQVPVLI